MKDELILKDDFSCDRTAGAVIGTPASSGQKRLGVDVEKVLGIDNGALRISPLIEAGFGRAVIAYGPFPRREGLAFSVLVLNGHNTAQAEPLLETFRERLFLWLRGSEDEPKSHRVTTWLASGRVRRTLRQFRWWWRTAKGSCPVPPLDENLAVGWFPADIVQDPRLEGNPFVMHALGPENGELWTGGKGSRTRPLRGVQNLPLYLVSVLRAGGAVYYVSSIDGALGFTPYPSFRPVAVEQGTFPEELYLGIQQSVLGQIGWRIDSRIKAVRAAYLEGYGSWFAGAQAADRLAGDEDLDGVEAEAGGAWRIFGNHEMGILSPVSPPGLIHAVARQGRDERARVGLVWRFSDEFNHWRMELGDRACEIISVEEGERRVLAAAGVPGPGGARTRRLQVLDDGRRMMAYVDGEPVAERWIDDTRLGGMSGAGIILGGCGHEKRAITFFEAHPRSVEMPGVLSMESPWLRKGVQVVVADDFEGGPGDLEDRMTMVGCRRWSRVMGSGVMETTGDGSARIRGSVDDPCPGRTAYCVGWETPDFADLEAAIVPPGTERGQKQQSTAGFLLYQDPENFMALNVWRADSYGGASISSFFKIGGFEDLYDAVWTNVGDRVYYGRPSRLRVCCDGERYIAFVDDEPVLYRAFRDVYADAEKLRIRKVGLLANWEFGNDTGSRFGQFRARI